MLLSDKNTPINVIYYSRFDILLSQMLTEEMNSAKNFISKMLQKINDADAVLTIHILMHSHVE